MLVSTPLLSGILVARYKRFPMDVRVGDEVITVHCPNSGSMANRAHGRFVRPCHERDPQYAKALIQAADSGIEIIAYRTRIEPPRVCVGEKVPVIITA